MQYNNLPANPEAQEHPDWNFNNGLPVNFQPPQVYQNLASIMPMITGTVIRILQDKKTDNHFRMFLFNLAAQNNYNNQCMAELVNMVAEYAATKLYSGQTVNERDAVEFTAAEIIAAMALYNVQKYQALAAYLNNNIGANSVTTCINLLSTIQNVINGHKNNMNNRGGQIAQPQQQQYYNQQQQYGNNNMGGQRTNMQMNQPVTINASSLVNNNRVVSNGVAPGTSGRYEDVATKPLVAPQVVPVAAPTALPATTTFASTGTEIRWTPSSDYPFYPAVNSVNSIVVLKMENNIVVPTIIARERKPMDFNKHSMGSGFGNLLEYDQLPSAKSKKIVVMDANVTELTTAAVLAVKNDKDIATYTGVVNPKMFVEASLDIGWLDAFSNLKRASFVAAEAGKKVVMYKLYVSVADILFINDDPAVDDKVFIEEIAGIPTFDLLQTIMLSVKDRVSISTWIYVNRRLTDYINSRLAKCLGLEYTIDSFASDYAELVDVIRTSLGDIIISKLESNSEVVINNMFTDSIGELSKPMVEVETENEEGKTEIFSPKHLCLQRNYSLTALELYAHDLTIEFSTEFSSQILPDQNPELYSLAESLFDPNYQLNSQVERHLVKLLDGFVFEITRGAFMANVYLFTLISK